ncbi:unnamed protein product [Kluyveromyces dobzhanskii CBS 2104]|uniref:WGS project CCBQ000000000 data, contig 00106 n=1 Tax=Kluyveromyces dobzhanskii CBS 2104 TaxID=1427455 RepID=A0A0A8L5B3_9SACH|nr:unnamed protein product [Kluyveromyces dobzhanskii CBS 2104]
MDLDSEIIQLIRQNARPKFSSLNDEQQTKLDNALKGNFNYDLLRKELAGSIDDFKRERFNIVVNDIGDLQRLELGNLLNGNGISLAKLQNDLNRLPRFQLVDNENESDQSLLREYNHLRLQLIMKCNAIETMRHEMNADVNYQIIDSMSRTVDLKNWHDEVEVELKELAQNLELILKSWPELNDEKRSQVAKLIGASSLMPILNVKGEHDT